VAIGSMALCVLPAAALQCPAMPQQASRDAEVEVRVGVRMLGDAKGAELQTRTRQLTTELMSRLPHADQVYLEQMLFASYCSALRDNPALGESEREARIGAYAREMRAALKAPAPTSAPPVDPRDRARAELDRLPVPYTIDAFVDAARRGDARVVGLFIAAGLDVNGRDREGYLALAEAAGRGDLPMVQALLKAGARVDEPMGRFGHGRALGWAAAGGHEPVVRAMLAARPSRQTVSRAFVAAASGGQVAMMTLLRDAGADLATVGSEALDEAIGAGGEDTPDRTAVVRRLSEWGVSLVAVDDRGWDPLIYAVDQGKKELVQMFLDAGADINRRCACQGYFEGGLTPLSMAAVSGRNHAAAIVDLLLAHGASVEVPTNEGRTPLMLALDRYGRTEVAERLVSAGANPNVADQRGHTALGLAAQRHPDLLRKLLAAGADPNLRDSRGGTPLMDAAAEGKLESLGILLDAGAEINAQSKRGRTALMVAVLSHEPNAARLLLQRGARTDLQDEDGKTAEAHAQALDEGRRAEMLRALRQGKKP
jgi:ankyrin repeat protein